MEDQQYRKLAEVEKVAALDDAATVLICQDGDVKRISKNFIVALNAPLAGEVSQIGARLTATEADLGTVILEVESKAEQEDLDVVEGLLSELRSKTNTLGIEMEFKAEQSYAEEISADVGQLRSEIETLRASIPLKADELRVYAVDKRVVANTENIELNAKSIEVNAESIKTNAARIDTVAGDVNTVAERITTVANEVVTQAEKIDLQAKEISLKVSDGASSVNFGEVNAGTVWCSQLNDGRPTTREELDTEIVVAKDEVLITAKELITIESKRIDILGDILNLSTQEGDGDNEYVSLVLNGMNQSITAQANEIHLKADKTYVDTLVADYIKASELESRIAEISTVRVTAIYASQGIDASSGSGLFERLTVSGTATLRGEAVATEAWVQELGYVVADDVRNYCTNMGFITASYLTTNQYTTATDVRNYCTNMGFLTSSDLEQKSQYVITYINKTVNSAGYVTNVEWSGVTINYYA